MIEKTVLQHLQSALACPVLLEIPPGPPDRFVLIEKTGGSRSEHIRRATFAVQSWADSLFEAAELNEQVKAAMDTLADRDEVSACRLNAEYNFTDIQTKHYRYQAVFDLVFY